MKKRGMLFLVLFVVWTLLLQIVDVQIAGESATKIGFATLNCWFHNFTGVHMWIYSITDWLGLVPVFVCLLFGMIGFMQLLKRRNLLKVDKDLLALGIYYVLVIFAYLIFEMIPINYRPILIEGRMEASYPSSTTLLVLSVMPTLVFQVKRRMKKEKMKIRIIAIAKAFTIFMIIGRLISGVHWFTDIVGSVLLSMGLFFTYETVILLLEKEEKEREALQWNLVKNFKS